MLRSPAAIMLLLLLSSTALAGQSSVQDLRNAGSEALRNKNGALASRLFAEALALKPNDPDLMYGAGVAAFLLGKNDEALWRLKRTLEFDPKYVQASYGLGRIAHDIGDLDLAIATYERALRYAPKDATLIEGLAEWRTEAAAHRSFTERRDRGFTVLYEGRADEDMAILAIDHLARARQQIAERLRVFPSNTIYVVLYTEQQFRDITRNPVWSRGMYDGRIRVPTAGAKENPALFEHVLTHELAHAVLEELAPHRAPAWIHEGIAQFLSGADPAQARRRLKGQTGPILLKNFEPGFGTRAAADALFAYDVSLVAINLVFDRAGAGWGPFFSDLAEGTPCDAALSRRFGIWSSDLEAALLR